MHRVSVHKLIVGFTIDPRTIYIFIVVNIVHTNGIYFKYFKYLKYLKLLITILITIHTTNNHITYVCGTVKLHILTYDSKFKIIQ